MITKEQLLTTFPIDSKTAQDCIDVLYNKDEEIDLATYAAGKRRIQECFNPPERYDVQLHILDSLLSGCGVETIPSSDDTSYNCYGIEFVNMGDAYHPTICFDLKTRKFRLNSWGNIVEANPDRFQFER